MTQTNRISEVSEICTRVKAGGLRKTKQRTRLVELLVSQSEPISVDHLLRLLGPEFDMVTLYRCLRAFEKIGLVYRVYRLRSGAVWGLMREDIPPLFVESRKSGRFERIESQLIRELYGALDSVRRTLIIQGYRDVSCCAQFIAD
jgi:Fur family ferric uptake transcriptional regulator